MSGEVPGPDFKALVDGLDQYREVLRAMVAGLVADGFTDEQARRLVVHVMTTPSTEEKP